jgi:thymidylate synthase (FAD)
MVKLINSYMTEADLCEIARISTGKKSRADEELIRFLIEQQHDSIFEHAIMTFLVEVPIYTARQWQRHRIGSFTEKSGRYSEMEDFELTINCDDAKAKGGIVEDVKWLFRVYENLIKGGIRKEEARQILPLCTLTKFYWTVNLRSLMNFLSLRMDPHAQQDIRENAKEVCKLFENSYPTIARRWLEREAAIKKFLSERRRIE